jgi:hypothetical protein
MLENNIRKNKVQPRGSPVTAELAVCLSIEIEVLELPILPFAVCMQSSWAELAVISQLS